MHSHTQPTWKRHTLWLSLLLHLLMLLSMTVVVVMTRDPMPSTSPQAIQSYLAPAPEQAPSQSAQPSQQSAITPLEAPPVEKKSEPKQVANDVLKNRLPFPRVSQKKLPNLRHRANRISQCSHAMQFQKM